MNSKEPIAIVGYAFRFPGDLDTEEALWKALKDGQDLVTEVPADRWATQELQHNQRKELGRSITFSAGVRSRIDEFDASFFGISPREANWMDPQQRMLLELAWEALENAGQKPADLAGYDCAVYVGISSLDYSTRAIDDLASIGPNYMTGNALSIAANRLSYALDLRGPSVSVDTACSSSLVALHHACNSLRSGEASSALVGGVSLLLHPYPFVGFTKASMLSEYGRCRAFDASGAGYVRGEGGAVLMLKPLSQAKADGDTIHALILASGVNADGAPKTGITIPSAEGQQALMRAVLERSGIDSADIDYIEAHGTGTAVGDPVEAAAIGAIYGQGRAQNQRALPIGSVKTNIGHMEAASGMGGLIKAILAIKHRAIPPTIHCQTPNPKIDFAGLKLQVAREFQTIDKPENDPIRVGVNSFGFGGANAHVILQGSEQPSSTTPTDVTKQATPPIFLSAQSEPALKQLAANYAELIERSAASYYDIAYSAVTTRDCLTYRLAVSAASPEGVTQSLRAIASGIAAVGAVQESALADAGGVGFVYSGNGSQWHGMGRQLLTQSPQFAARFAELDAQMQDAVGFSILEAIQSDDPETIADTTRAQPLLFAIQVCMTEQLKSVGIKPTAFTGHSVGEVASAWASGALSLESAIRVIAARSQAQGLTRGSGRMAAAAIAADEATALIKSIGVTVELCGINSPDNVTLSGDLNELEKMQKVLESRGTFFRVLDLDYAFHSTHMDPIRKTLAASLHGLSADTASDATYVSTVTGDALTGTELGADYWWDNIRQPVLFEKAIATMAELGCRVFVEIGPNAILQRYIAETLAAQQITGRVLPTLTRQAASAEQLTAAALRVQLVAEPFDPWAYFTTPGTRVRLPNYPWQKERYWHPETVESQQLIQRRRVHPLLGWPLNDADATWENTIDTTILPWLADHNVGGSIVFPGACYVEMALAAASEWLRSKHLAHKHLALEGLDILAPMVYEEGHARQLRLTLNPSDCSFDIRSRPRLSEQDWTIHAVGRVIEAGAKPARSVLPETLLQPAHTINAETHYAQTAALGLHYGPRFQGIERVTLAQQDIQIQVCEGVAQDEPPYHLPPNVLDLAFQSLVELLQMEDPTGQGNNSEQATAYLPVSIEKLAVYAQSPVCSIRGRLRKQSRRSVLADFELFDAAGALVANATGCRFRAAPLQSQHANEPDIWVEKWQLAPRANEPIAPAYPPIAQLAQCLAARAAQRTNIAERQRWHQEQRPLIEALALAYLYEAFQEVEAFLPELFAQPDQPNQPKQPLIHWAITCLQQEGLLSESNGQWQLVQDAQLPASQSIWQALIQEAPNVLPQILALARIAKNLPTVLRGELSLEDLKAVLAQSTIADNLLDESPVYAGSQWLLQEILTQIANSLPANRALRVLEISAGSSNLARPLLARLLHDRLSYQLAVPDEATADRLRAQFADNANVAVSTIDLANWQLAGTSNTTSVYDVIILRHALHRASQTRAAMAQTQRMLAQGGLLLLAEQGPSLAEDLLNLVQTSLNPANIWQQALLDEGFENISIARELEAQDQEGVPYIVLAQKPLATHAQPVMQDALPASWVLLADNDSAATAQSIAERLTQRHQDVIVQQVDYGTNLPTDLVFADKVVAMLGWGANAQSANAVLRDVLVTLQALSATGNKQTPPQLTVVTHGDAAVSRALTGLIRVAMNEMPQLGCRIIDIVADLNEAQLIAELETELMATDAVNEVRLSAAGRFAPVLQVCTSADFAAKVQPEATTLAPDSHRRTRLDFTAPGQLRNLSWFSEDAKPLAANGVEIATKAVGLNFRDIMYTMGLLRDEAVENGFAGSSLGLEFSGVVTRVGAEVTGYQPGQPVMGFGSACFASHIVAPANAIAPMPEGWTFDAAATVPTAFFTVYYALKHLANLQPGERVLIHGAAGGVGIAAIQLAQYLGAEIYATAGTEEKRDFVRQLGVQHIYDSRNLDFAEIILADTAGEGVDVVLNSLAGEAIRRNLQVLKPFGRFLELGKRDFFENTAIGLRPFKDNISYFGIDADQLLNGRPDLAAQLFSEVMALFREGVLYPLPLRSFKAHQVIDAFRAMQQSRHIGKIVVSMSEAPAIKIPKPAIQSLQLDKNSTWLVTGGISGFGLASAQWLASRGAGHLVLISRRGMATPGAKEAIASLQALGATVEVAACDITDRAALAALVHQVQATQPPIKGVLHAAAHFDDAVISGLNAERFNAVLAPKLLGAWNLHEATRALPLEHFILYSSITTAIGNLAQANYVAANAALEGLAQLRHSQDLPALAIGWGPIADAGYLTRNTVVKDSLAQRLGKAPLTASEALNQLDWLLTARVPHVSVARIDWATLCRHLPSANTLRFAELNRTIQGKAVSDTDDIQSIIQGKTFAEIQELISTRVTQKVARILSISPERIEAHKPLHDLGMDSLMAVELALSMEQRFKLQLPAMLLNDAPTIQGLSLRISGMLVGDEEAENSETPSAMALFLKQHGETLPDGDLKTSSASKTELAA